MVVHERRRPVVRVHIGEFFVVVLDEGRFVDLVPHAPADHVPIHGHVPANPDPDARSLADFADRVGGGHENFRRNAAAVQAGAAEAAPLHDGDAPALGQGGVGNDIGSAGTNQKDIITFHGIPPYLQARWRLAWLISRFLVASSIHHPMERDCDEITKRKRDASRLTIYLLYPL